MQGFAPNTPAMNSLGVSQVMRDNFMSLLDNHAGPALPAYATAGMFWHDTVNNRICYVKARGTKAYAQASMGALLTLHVTRRQPGLNGSTVALNVRVQDSTLLAGDADFTASPAQKLFFSSAKPPAFFAAKAWNDPLINDPIILSNDGILTGKTWEAFAPGTHETVYATGLFSNEANYASNTLRAVDVEGDRTEWETDLHIANGIDHFVIGCPLMSWHDVQEAGGKMRLLFGGMEMDPASYRIKPFLSNGAPAVAVYSVEPVSGISLVPFANGRYTLRIRKPS